MFDEPESRLARRFRFGSPQESEQAALPDYMELWRYEVGDQMSVEEVSREGR